MATSTLANLFVIKNTEKVHFIGLVFVSQPASKTRNPKSNSTMETGGEAFLMALANTKRPMVSLSLLR